MWDWNILSGEIYVGDSIEEVFGYKVKNNTVRFEEFSECLQPEQKKTVLSNISATLESTSKIWKDSFLFKRNNDSVAITTSRASIVRDDSGKAIRLIGAIHDITRVHELENKLEQNIAITELQTEKGVMAATLSFGVIWDWKTFTKEILIAEGYEELFGYGIDNTVCDMSLLNDHIHPDDKEIVKKTFEETLQSTSATWQYTYRIIRADGTITKIFNRASIFRDPDGKANRVMGLIQDITQPVVSAASQQLSAVKKNSLIDKIKQVIVQMFQHSDEVPQTNFSNYLSEKLEYDYNYLSNLFSEVEGMPIRQFIIEQKIMRAKELILKNELTLTQIALKLHYSSIAHLSNQFKKVTGLTPSHFKELHPQTEPALSKV
jgi:PAS domain S-box-containing protein